MDIETNNQLQLRRNLVIIGIVFVAILVRLNFIHFQSADFVRALNNWYEFIRQHDGFGALKFNFSEYNTPYLYLLVLAYYLVPKLSSLVVIKSISIFFDFFGAFFAAKLVQLKYPSSQWFSVATFAAVLLAPTVVVNSAAWGQADMIYTSFLLAFLYYLIKRKEVLAAIAFGIAFSFKLQTAFLAPLVFILLLKRLIGWKFCLIVPATYLLLLLPAWISGRPFLDLLLIYLAQSGTYEDLTKHAPNLYQWISDDYFNIFVPLGLLWTSILVAAFVFWLYRIRTKIDSHFILRVAIISALAVPYFLPKMHERYFFVADVLSIVFAFYFPRFFFLPLIVIASSLLSYAPFLLDKLFVSLKVQSIFLLVLLVVLLKNLRNSLSQQEWIKPGSGNSP